MTRSDFPKDTESTRIRELRSPFPPTTRGQVGRFALIGLFWLGLISAALLLFDSPSRSHATESMNQMQMARIDPGYPAPPQKPTGGGGDPTTDPSSGGNSGSG
jgi:hypothetical protein